MNNGIKPGLPWPRERFFAAIAVLFILQAGLLLLFGSHSQPAAPPPGPSIRFCALSAPGSEDQLLNRYFVADPAIFPLPNAHGFSGRGWLNRRPREFQPEIQLEPPIWLNFNTNWLETQFSALPSNPDSLAPGLPEHLAPRLEPWPAFLVPDTMPARSVFHLEGALADRLLGVAPALRVWTNAQPLINTVVQIAINPAGEVIAARLDSRCGLADADADALAKSRTLRFSARATGGAQWGAAVFQWQTAGPAAAGPLK